MSSEYDTPQVVFKTSIKNLVNIETEELRNLFITYYFLGQNEYLNNNGIVFKVLNEKKLFYENALEFLKKKKWSPKDRGELINILYSGVYKRLLEIFPKHNQEFLDRLSAAYEGCSLLARCHITGAEGN